MRDLIPVDALTRQQPTVFPDEHKDSAHQNQPYHHQGAKVEIRIAEFAA